METLYSAYWLIFKKRTPVVDVLTFLLFITPAAVCSFLSSIQSLLYRVTEEFVRNLTDTLGALRHLLTWLLHLVQLET